MTNLNDKSDTEKLKSTLIQSINLMKENIIKTKEARKEMRERHSDLFKK